MHIWEPLFSNVKKKSPQTHLTCMSHKHTPEGSVNQDMRKKNHSASYKEGPGEMGVGWITDAPLSLKTFSGRGDLANAVGREHLYLRTCYHHQLPNPQGLPIRSGQETASKHLLCARHCARGRDLKVSKTQSLLQLSTYDVPISLHSLSHLTLTTAKCYKNHPHFTDDEKQTQRR